MSIPLSSPKEISRIRTSGLRRRYSRTTVLAVNESGQDSEGTLFLQHLANVIENGRVIVGKEYSHVRHDCLSRAGLRDRDPNHRQAIAVPGPMDQHLAAILNSVGGVGYCQF